MSIARRTNLQSGNSGTTSASAITVTKPTDAAAGDVLIVGIWMVDNAVTTAPTASQASFTQLGTGAASSYGKLQVFYRVIQAGDPASWSFTLTRAAIFEWAAIAYSGADNTTPIPTFAFVTTPGSTLTDVTASITPSSVNNWIIAIFADRTTTTAQKTTGWAATAPNVERAETNNNSKSSSPWGSFEYCDDGAAIGSTAAVTRTSVRTGPTANTNWQACIIDLAAAAAGSTPISGTDTNDGTTETATPDAQIPDTDANGGTTETATQTAQIPSSDASSTTTESAAITVPVSSSDANGSTTEASTVAVPASSSDAGGATTETALLAVHSSSSDANGATTESTKIALSASDAAGATTEAATITVPVSSSDSNAAAAEIAALAAAAQSSDISGAVNEGASLVASVSVSDASSAGVDSATIVAKPSSADANGTTIESGSVSSAGAPSGTDSNGPTTEAANVVFAQSTADAAGPVTETASVRVFVSAADVSGSTTEAASARVTIVATDAGGLSAETGGVVYRPNVVDSSGATSEVGSLLAHPLATDTNGPTTETTSPPRIIITSTDFGSAQEVANLVTRVFDQDFGIGTETWSKQAGQKFPEGKAGSITGGLVSGTIERPADGTIKVSQPPPGSTEADEPGRTAKPMTGRVE